MITHKLIKLVLIILFVTSFTGYIASAQENISQPPRILVKGHEKEAIQGNVTAQAEIGKELLLSIFIDGLDPQNGGVTATVAGIPQGANFEFKQHPKVPSRGIAKFTWNPKEENKGSHTIVINSSNGKGLKSAIQLVINVN